MIDTDPSLANKHDIEQPEKEILTWTELYAKYRMNLVRTAKNSYRLSDPEGSVQEVFTRALGQFEGPDDKGKVNKAWLDIVLRRIAIDESRRPSTKRTDVVDMNEFEGHFNDLPADDDVENEALDDLEFKETQERVKELLSESPPHWYPIFMKYAVEDKKYQQIADEMGISLGTVRSAIFRIKALLSADEEIRKKQFAKSK